MGVVDSELLIHELLHGIIAAPFVLLIFSKTKSKRLAVLLIILSYLIDIDHFVDYFSYYGFRFNLNEFLSGEHFKVTQGAFIPFHAWEWILLAGFIGFKRGWNSIFTVIALAMIPHILFDSFIQKNFLFYSIFYRAVVSNFGYLW